MAGKNDFRSLKQFGTKELKFKQGVHIEAAYKGHLLSAPVYTAAKKGLCAALTMEWLKAKLSEGKYRAPFNPAPMYQPPKTWCIEPRYGTRSSFKRPSEQIPTSRKWNIAW